MIRNFPLVFESPPCVCSRGLSSHRHWLFVFRKIGFVFGFMVCFPMVRNVSLVLESRLRVCVFIGCPHICIGSLSLKNPFRV